METLMLSADGHYCGTMSLWGRLASVRIPDPLKEAAQRFIRPIRQQFAPWRRKRSGLRRDNEIKCGLPAAGCWVCRGAWWTRETSARSLCRWCKESVCLWSPLQDSTTTGVNTNLHPV